LGFLNSPSAILVAIAMKRPGQWLEAVYLEDLNQDEGFDGGLVC